MELGTKRVSGNREYGLPRSDDALHYGFEVYRPADIFMGICIGRSGIGMDVDLLRGGKEGGESLRGGRKVVVHDD